MRWSASAPANLLLLGEYAVTTSGGLGIFLAVKPRATASFVCEAQTSTFIFQGDWTSKRFERLLLPSDFSPAALTHALPDGPQRLVLACAAVIGNYLHEQGLPLPGPGCLQVDSRCFFLDQGRKTGLGSSAVSCLLACAGFLLPQNKNLPSTFQDSLLHALPQLAIAAHRFFQSGRGSGYDIAASFCGGVGLFSGGEHPLFNQICPTFPLALSLGLGPHAVSSGSSVKNFNNWAASNPKEVNHFLQANNELVTHMVNALSVRNASSTAADYLTIPDILTKAARLGAKLGATIGVPADPGAINAKCLGAGNESIVFFGPARSDNNQNAFEETASKLVVEAQGFSEDLE